MKDLGIDMSGNSGKFLEELKEVKPDELLECASNASNKEEKELYEYLYKVWQDNFSKDKENYYKNL